ncbi:MAG: RDD family protein [Campylobacterales bacterium]|nr:RDD family protein [Campylobacterales bacterium]
MQRRFGCYQTWQSRKLVRWRTLKQGKKSPPAPSLPCFPLAPTTLRVKAFIVDVFMIYLPLLYLTTYGILGGKDAFQSNQLAIFLLTLLFGVILSLFWMRTGQSPGYRVYGMRLVHARTGKSPSFLLGMWRYLAFLLAGTSMIGLMLSPFRKDGKNLHDLLSGTHATLVTP